MGGPISRARRGFGDADVTRKSLWEWWKLEAFRKAVRERVEKLTEAERTPILNALFREAKSGDVPAMRLFFQLRGELTEKHEVQQTLREVKVSERAAGLRPSEKGGVYGDPDH